MNAKPYAGWLLFLAGCGGSSFTANDSAPLDSGGGTWSVGGDVGSGAGTSNSAGGTGSTIGGSGNAAGGSTSAGGSAGTVGVAGSSAVGGASLGGSVGQGGGQTTGGSPDQGGTAGSLATAGSGGDMGGSIGTTGGTDPGGNGGVGGTVISGGTGGASAGTAGTAGSGTVDCTTLQNTYLADLAKARVCDQSKSQCSTGSTLPGTCCPVLVAAGTSATLRAKQDYQAFTNAGCFFASCGVACVAYSSASCAVQAGTGTRWCTGSGTAVP